MGAGVISVAAVASSPAAATPVCFTPLGQEQLQSQSRLCAQTFVSQRACLPMVSVFCLDSTAPPAALLPLQRQLALFEGYPNLEWLVARAPGLSMPPAQAPLPQQAVAVSSAAADAALSALAAVARGEFIWLLSPESLPQLFCLFQLLVRLRAHPQVGAVGAWHLDASGRLLQGGWVVDGDQLRPLNEALRPQLGEAAKAVRQVAAVAGSCLLLRRSSLAQLGPVAGATSPALAAALCAQLGRRGQKTVVAPAAQVCEASPEVAPLPRLPAQFDASASAPSLAQLLQAPQAGAVAMDLSVVSCINDTPQYISHVWGSLLNGATERQIEVLPIHNAGNAHSAASALNLGIETARADVVVLCHQDVIFYKAWVDLLFLRLAQLGKRPWGILGTAGIRLDGVTSGIVQKIDGSFDWNTRFRHPLIDVQTVDEHCMILRKSSGVRFDAATLDGFHFYGPDVCLSAAAQGQAVVGIYNPLVHNGSGGSLRSGEEAYQRLMQRLAAKWSASVPLIRTPTGLIRAGQLTSYLRF